jgi:hypothetical protein
MAALVPQRVSFPIAAGQEQGAAPELLDPPVLMRAHNCYYNRAGELTKRRGWRIAPATADGVSGYPYLPIPDRVATRGDEILWIGETYDSLIEAKESIALLSRVPGETHNDAPPERWRSKGRMPRFSSRKLLELSHSDTGQRVQYWDCAFAGDDGSVSETEGLVCSVWRTRHSGEGNDIGRVEFAVIDVRTRAVLYQSVITTVAFSNTIARVISAKHADGDWYFHIFYVIETEATRFGDVYLVTVPAERPWDAEPPSIFSFGVANFDACVNDIDAAERRVFVGVTMALAPSILSALEYIPQAGGVLSLATSTDMTLDVVPDCIATHWSLSIACDPQGNEIGCHLAHTAIGCVGNPGNIFATFKAGAAPAHSLVGFDCIQSAGPDDVSGGYGGTQIVWAGTHIRDGLERSDNFWISWERVEPKDQGLLFQLSFSVASAPLVLEVPRCATMTRRPWGRPFWFRGNAYIPTVQGCAADTTVLEIVSPYRLGATGEDPGTGYWVAGRALSGEINFNSSLSHQSFSLAEGHNSFVESNYERGRFFTVVPVVSIDGTQNNLALIDFDAREPNRFESAELDNATYFASSMPWCYDGGYGHEIGFPCRPQSLLGEIEAFGAASSSPLVAGEYYVAACWESIDSLGKRSQSAPSKTHVTVAQGQTIAIRFLNLCVTSHHNVKLVVYVSNDGGINYVRSAQIIENQVYQGEQREVELQDFQLFNANAPTLYTDSGILSNTTPPSARFACEFQGRVWFANDRNVYPSRELVDGEEPCFNEALWFRLHHDITGILGFDDRLVIWHRNGIYWVAGDGPTDTGEGGAFSQPQRVPTDFGCIDARSIVRTSKGILYQSSRGIELIDQSLAPRSEPVSGGIDRLLRESGYTEITTSCWDQRYALARFVLRNPTTGYCIIAQWHATFELWTTSGMPVVTDSGRVDTFGDIVSAFGSSWMAVHDSPSGAHATDPLCYLLREKQPGDSLLYLDGFDADPHDYQMQVETANVKLDGLNGFARVRRAYVLAKDLYEESGTPQTGFGLRVAIDYSASPEPESTWVTADDVDACKTESDGHYRFGIHVAKQQCSAIRLVIRDSGALESNEQHSYGFTLVGFGLEWGQKVGTGRGSARSKK